MTRKTRLRLRVEDDRWCIDRGAWAPKTRDYRWVPVSNHFTLERALAYAREFIVMHGYSPVGLDQLLAKIETSTALIEGWARAMQENPQAELEIP